MNQKNNLLFMFLMLIIFLSGENEPVVLKLN
jgi:hypothetical protein